MKFFVNLSLIAIAALFALPPAYGQGAGLVLEEIVVTARKR